MRFVVVEHDERIEFLDDVIAVGGYEDFNTQDSRALQKVWRCDAGFQDAGLIRVRLP